MSSAWHRLAALVLLLFVVAPGGATPAVQAGTPVVARGVATAAAAAGGSGRWLLASKNDTAAAAVSAGAGGGAGAAGNITATYRGDWAKLGWPAQLPSGLLRQSGGVAVLKLRTVGEPEGGVTSVHGDLVLRDGQFVSSGDIALTVQGVYVAAAGKLTAVVEPVGQPLKLLAAPEGEEEQQGGAAEQQGVVEQQEGPEERLRSAARQVALLAAQKREAGVEPQQLPDPSEGFQAARSWQLCELMLELSVAQPPAPAAPPAAAGAGQAQAASAPPTGGSAGLVLGRRGTMPGGEQQQQQPADQGGGSAVLVAVADLIFNGTLTSRGCGIQLELNLATAHLEEYYHKAMNYTLLVTAVGFLQVLLLVRQMEACATPALASRVSLLMLAFQAVLDAYLCLVHLTLGILIDSLFHSFGSVAFMQFVVFAIFEMRFLLSVWRARRPSIDAWTAQREISVLYARFYAALLGGILLTYQLQRHMPLLVFGFYSWWWPQIVLCVRGDCRQPLKPEFVLGMSAARLALPLYLWGCPSNLLRVQPNPGLCIALVAYVGLQCGLLLAQHWRGPRCFVPKRLLPRRYDYSRPVPAARGGSDIETGEGGRECVICMTPVDISNKQQRAVTPCNHVFHLACLERWLSFKADCPVCRRQLPPL